MSHMHEGFVTWCCRPEKMPVLYVGLQEGFIDAGIPDFHLVDEPSGTTKKFDSDKHVIVGLAESARQRGVHIPNELIVYCKLRY